MNNSEKLKKIIEREKAEATKFHKTFSAYSTALINRLECADSNEVINGWVDIGDVELEFLTIKRKVQKNREPRKKYVKLDSYDKPCIQYADKPYE